MKEEEEEEPVAEEEMKMPVGPKVSWEGRGASAVAVIRLVFQKYDLEMAGRSSTTLQSRAEDTDSSRGSLDSLLAFTLHVHSTRPWISS